MKHKSLLLFVLLFLSTNVFSQSLVVQQILNTARQDSLIYFVRELSGNVPTIINGTSQTISSRNKFQPGNALAETYIKQKLQSYGLTTTIQSFSTTGKNVYAVQQGTEFPNQKFIICAHFDDMPSGTTAPGADDNASGTAAVIEAARIFSQYDFSFTIVYALWDEEEQGLIGSEYYTTQAANAGDSILGVINMDMIAYDGNGDGNADVHNSSVANTGELKDKMLEVNLLYGINLDLDVVPAQPYSDHQSFLVHGYGAILLIEDDNDFHPYYHTVNDLIQYFNQPYFFKMAKLSFATLASFALNLNLNIIHTPIPSTTQTTPIIASALISTGLDIGTGNLSPRLYYRARTGGGTFGSFNSVVGVPTESGYYTFTIPSLSLGTIVQYYLAAQDANSTVVNTLPAGGGGFSPPGSTPPPTFFQFYVASQVVAFYDEAININNWTSIGGWNITTSIYVSPPTSFTDSPGGSYSNNVNSSLKYSSQISLSDVLGATLEFDTQWDIENDWDYGQIQISTNNGSTWTALIGLFTNPGTGSFQPNGEPLYDGTQLTWVHETMDISNYVNQNISLRFLFRSDGYITQDGWYVDNIAVIVYTIIPVELTSFTATAANDKVIINWSTATELNNLGFEIERSSNLNDESKNRNWQTLGYVDGSGTTTENQNYSFIDKNPSTGISYYRLKQIDFDGTFKLYNELKIEFSSVTDYELAQNYPNPFNPSTTIDYSIHVGGHVSLKVYNLLGSEVAMLVDNTQEAGRHSVEFSTENLGTKIGSGVYLYTLKSGEFVRTRKMIILK